MKDRAGELWEERQNYQAWELLLVLHTERDSFDVRVHTCLNLHTHKIVRMTEELSDIWEHTPKSHVMRQSGRFFSYTEVVERRKVWPV